MTPLTIAVRYGLKDKVEILLKAGADPSFPRNENWAPLHWAAATNNIEIAEMLIKAGANVNATDVYGGKNTPTMIAALWGYKDFISFMESAGANMDARNENGETYGIAVWITEK